MEHHPLDVDVGLWRQDFEQVPGDGLSLAVFVCGEKQLVGLFEQLLQLAYLGALVGGNHIQRFEIVVDVDSQPGPRFAPIGRRHLAGVAGQITDVPGRGFHHVAAPQKTRDGLGFGRRLDDYEGVGHGENVGARQEWLSSRH